jgi:hypothetical protein
MMSPRRRRTETPTGSDTGSVTLFLAITVLGLLVLLGLVVDGGAKIRAVQHADAVAADAARAGGPSINVPAAITVDARAAIAAANTSLRRADVTGTVYVTDAGQSLNVEVTTTTRTIFLGLIGITTITVHGHAHVTLVRGVTGATP